MSITKPNFRKLVRHLRVAEDLKTQILNSEEEVTIVSDAWSWKAFREAARQCGLELRIKSEVFHAATPAPTTPEDQKS